MVGDILATVIEHAKNDGQIEGIVVDSRLSIIQYADDMIFIVEQDLENARNMKLLFFGVREILGSQYELEHNQILCFGEAQDEAT